MGENDLEAIKAEWLATHFSEDYEQVSRHVPALVAEVEALRAALRPFASIYRGGVPPYIDDDEWITPSVRVGWIRTADRLLGGNSRQG